MSKVKKRVGVVYSSDPNFKYTYEDSADDAVATLAPGEQRLLVLLDKKKRRGQEVTLVQGFVGQVDDLKALGKQLKTKCGVGGSVKDNEVIIQGNHKDQIMTWLLEHGYCKSKKR